MSTEDKNSIFYSIRTKFTVLLVVFVGILMLSTLGFINRTVGEIVLDQGLDKGLAVARGIATSSADPLLTDDDLTLFTTVRGVTETKGILYGMIVSKDKVIKAHSTVAESGKTYAKPAGSETLKKGENYWVKTYEDSALGLIYDITVPIKSVRLAESIGNVHIGIARNVIDEAVGRVNRFIKLLTVIGLVVAGGGALALTSVIVNPVRTLIKSAHAIGAGDFDHRIEVKRKDELGALMGAFNEMAEGLKQKQFIQESFGRYVAPEVLDMLLKEKETWFKGKKTNVTILFADIRGFTAFAEGMDPENLITLLNEYFGLMTSIIQTHKGYIDKFVGDEIMAVFGSPVHYEDHAVYASRAACEMQEKLRGFNAERPERTHLHVGIGINTGEVVAGNLGCEQKMEYAVIGDNVNIASRLCSAAKTGEILISMSAHDAIMNYQFKDELLKPLTVKGKAEPLDVFSLIPRRSPDRDPEAGPESRA